MKVALPRPLIINNTTHRPATIQRIRIGATTDGKIVAIAHESWSGDLPGGKPDGAVDQTRMLYAGNDRMTATRLAVLDLPEGNAMRAPGEATGHMALEIAMDEMAEKLGIDPVEFRILNDTQVVPDDSARPVTAEERPTLLAAQSGRMPATRRASASAGSKRSAKPGAHARRALARSGMGMAVGVSRQPAHEVGARACGSTGVAS